jgi:peptidoglycan/LPS O-acetylase OafA/YrhL
MVLTPLFRTIYAQPLPVEVQFGICVLLATVTVVAISVVSYRVIERPGMRLGSLLVRQARGRRTAVPQAIG